MTFSNRISFAGVIPLLVVAAVAVLAAIIVVAPGQSAKAAATPDACSKLSPVIWDMLKAHYTGLEDHHCNTFDPGTAGSEILRTGLSTSVDTDANAAIWDFSGQGLTSFAITDDDEATLDILFSTGGADDATRTDDNITADAVRYFDLTDNPLSVEDISFKHIPFDVAIILSVDSPSMGFQASSYELTEGGIGYVGVALPGTFEDATTNDATDNDIDVQITIGGSQADDALNSAILADYTPGIYGSLVTLGTPSGGTGLVRDIDLLNDDDDVAYYVPIKVDKDNENDGWEVDLSITTATDSNVTTRELDEVAILVGDADTPMTEVCDRSDDVVSSIMRIVGDGTNAGTTYGGTADRTRRCQELTLRDLGALDGVLHIVDEDTETITLTTATFTNGEPLEDLVSGDLEGLTGVDRLHLVGARALPSGIFAGVGGGSSGNDNVVIHFSANAHEDDEVEEVGNFKPSTIPSHIWTDQAKQQVIVLADDVDDKKNGVTKGLDADLYAENEGESIFVLTNAATASYVLGNSVNFTALRPGAPAPDLIMTAGIPVPVVDGLDLQGDGMANSKVVRFAITLPDVDKDTNMWLFLFNTSRNDATYPDPTTAADLKDLATVAIVDTD